MGVMEYNKDQDLDETLENNENDILNKLNMIQTQLTEFCQLLKELKNDIEDLKKKEV